MHKIGLKLYSTNAFYLKEAAELCERGVCDFIELLPVPGSAGKTLAMWKALQVPFVIHAAHFGFGVNLGRIEQFGKNMEAAKEALEFADALSAAYVIFHPGTEGNIREAARQLKAVADPRVLVENKPYKTIDGRFKCIGGSHEEIKLVMDTAGTGFCLDVSHAISYAKNIGVDEYNYLSYFFPMKPSMYHVSDGIAGSGADTHEHIGQGDYDWNRILPFIPSGSLVTIETKKDSEESLADFSEDARNYRRIMDDYFPVVSVRRAQVDDVRNVFELSNEPFVRQYSINKGQISWAEHEAWFAPKITDPHCDFFTVEVKGVFAAQVRYQLEAGRMVVSLSIASPYRGKGFASEILRSSARIVFATRPELSGIVAYIDPENSASARVFSKAGYIQVGKETISGRVFKEYLLFKDSI